MHSIFLRYFDEVARQGSIRKAANILNISSTSVNRKILSIEEQMGIKLFERSPEGVDLTPSGKIVLEHCRRTLYDFDSVKMVIDDLRDLRTGHLSIQTIDSFTFSVLPRILSRFSDEYPSISLSVTADVPESVSESVASGAVDIGINFTNLNHPGTRVVLEKPAPFGIIMPPDHPLAEKTNVEAKDLEGYPLVRTVDARGRNSILDQEMSAAYPNLKTHIFTNALSVAKQSILSNRAVGVYTKIGFLEEIEAKKLVFVPFAMKALREYRTGLIISATSAIDPVKRIFIANAEKVFKTLDFGP